MSDRSRPRGMESGMGVALGVVVGLLVGVAISIALHNWAFLGIGLCWGIVIGAIYEWNANKGQ